MPCGRLVSNLSGTKIPQSFAMFQGGLTENIEHMIYKCERVANIWKFNSPQCHLEKHSDWPFWIGWFCKVKDAAFQYCCLHFFKQWVIWKNTDRNYRHINLEEELCKELKLYTTITAKLEKYKEVNALLKLINRKWLS